MKKFKNAAKTSMTPNSSITEGIPARDPQADFIKKDATFKKSRGAPK